MAEMGGEMRDMRLAKEHGISRKWYRRTIHLIDKNERELRHLDDRACDIFHIKRETGSKRAKFLRCIPSKVKSKDIPSREES